MRFENEQKPCAICKAPSFLRTDGGKTLCPIHFIIYAGTDEAIEGTGTGKLALGENAVVSQALST